MAKSAIIEVIETIEVMLRIHPRGENFEQQLNEEVHKLFDLLDPHINAIQIEGKVYLREEFLIAIPTLDGIRQNLL